MGFLGYSDRHSGILLRVSQRELFCTNVYCGQDIMEGHDFGGAACCIIALRMGHRRASHATPRQDWRGLQAFTGPGPRQRLSPLARPSNYAMLRAGDDVAVMSTALTSS